MSQGSPFEHCCGLQGFGLSSHDVCPACYFNRRIQEGDEHNLAVLKTQIAKEKSWLALFPGRFESSTKDKIDKLEKELKNYISQKFKNSIDQAIRERDKLRKKINAAFNKRNSK